MTLIAKFCKQPGHLSPHHTSLSSLCSGILTHKSNTALLIHDCMLPQIVFEFIIYVPANSVAAALKCVL